MIKYLFTAILLILMLSSCHKPKGFSNFDEASWSRTGNGAFYMLTAGSGTNQEDELRANKILRISSQAELDTLILLHPYSLTGIFSNYNFDQKNIFVVYMDEYGQDYSKVKRSEVYINEGSGEIVFDFKISLPGGGGGMSHFDRLYFI